MPRRRRRPSKYRFLKPLGLTFVGIVGLVATALIEKAVCSMVHSASATATCSIGLPALIYYALWALIPLGMLGAGYRYYRDFFLGDIYNDLDE